jgi:hypothetical protein
MSKPGTSNAGSPEKPNEKVVGDKKEGKDSKPSVNQKRNSGTASVTASGGKINIEMTSPASTTKKISPTHTPRTPSRGGDLVISRHKIENYSKNNDRDGQPDTPNSPDVTESSIRSPFLSVAGKGRKLSSSGVTLNLNSPRMNDVVTDSPSQPVRALRNGTPPDTDRRSPSDSPQPTGRRVSLDVHAAGNGNGSSRRSSGSANDKDSLLPASARSHSGSGSSDNYVPDRKSPGQKTQRLATLQESPSVPGSLTTPKNSSSNTTSPTNSRTQKPKIIVSRPSEEE